MIKVVLKVPKWRVWVCNIWCHIVGRPLLALGLVSEDYVSAFCERMAKWVVDGVKVGCE